MLTHDHLADCDSRLFARCSFASLRVEAVALRFAITEPKTAR